ncbi:hypothetical protein K7432_012155, partial [Basidiobolus ranarum]
HSYLAEDYAQFRNKEVIGLTEKNLIFIITLILSDQDKNSARVHKVPLLEVS